MGIHPVHVVPLFISNHLQSELIVVAEKKSPLAGLRNRRCMLKDINDGETVLHADRHKHARHKRKVIGHMALVPFTEVSDSVLRPLICLRQQHAVLKLFIHMTAQFLQKAVRLRQVLAVGTFSLVEIGHRIQAKSRNSQTEPEINHSQDSLPHERAIEVEVRLMRVEAVPVISSSHRVPCPVR